MNVGRGTEEQVLHLKLLCSYWFKLSRFHKAHFRLKKIYFFLIIMNVIILSASKSCSLLIQRICTLHCHANFPALPKEYT